MPPQNAVYIHHSTMMVYPPDPHLDIVLILRRRPFSLFLLLAILLILKSMLLQDMRVMHLKLLMMLSVAGVFCHVNVTYCLQGN